MLNTTTFHAACTIDIYENTHHLWLQKHFSVSEEVLCTLGHHRQLGQMRNAYRLKIKF
jgi:hypothetical protein